eukprot:scaffold30415_cov124-Isochrysis_galbana.AAC.12
MRHECVHSWLRARAFQRSSACEIVPPRCVVHPSGSRGAAAPAGCNGSPRHRVTRRPSPKRPAARPHAGAPPGALTPAASAPMEPRARTASVMSLVIKSGFFLACSTKDRSSTGSLGRAPSSNCSRSQYACLSRGMPLALRSASSLSCCRVGSFFWLRGCPTEPNAARTARRSVTVGSPRRICICSVLMSEKATLRITPKSRMARLASVILGPLPALSPRSSATRSSVPMSWSTRFRSRSTSCSARRAPPVRDEDKLLHAALGRDGRRQPRVERRLNPQKLLVGEDRALDVADGFMRLRQTLPRYGAAPGIVRQDGLAELHGVLRVLERPPSTAHPTLLRQRREGPRPRDH